MHKNKHIYLYGYDKTENDLCKLESKYLFDKEEFGKILFSDIEIAPLSSAFIKKRLDIMHASDNYDMLIKDIKAANICVEGFKVEYVVLDGDVTEYPVRLSKLKDIGYSIEGNPDYYNPTRTYGLCLHDGIWYFGVLIKNDFTWRDHNQKPASYSNSISINIAKSLVNIAAKGDMTSSILDACCGVGTIMLEACFAGYKIEGCDINWKICADARTNLAHFGYKAIVYRSDVNDLSKRYDAAIIDLPYNLLSNVTGDDIAHIITSTAKISDRLVIVSTADITSLIHEAGFSIADYCSISKRGKTNFSRKVWICERNA